MQTQKRFQQTLEAVNAGRLDYCRYSEKLGGKEFPAVRQSVQPQQNSVMLACFPLPGAVFLGVDCLNGDGASNCVGTLEKLPSIQD